jgi:hypothetical protein
MPELQTVPELLGKAESAAAAGDLASADELLRAIARIQEDELGPLHPDLANTLNNLAIVAENTGRTGDAETFYRRAVAIASASLSPDDPMLAASRQNLEDFCRAQGLPIDGPAVVEPPTRAAEKSQAIAGESAGADAKASAVQKAADSHVEAPQPSPISEPSPIPQLLAVPQPPPVPEPSPIRDQSSVPRPTPSFAKIALAIVFLVIAALFVMRPWASRDTSSPASAPAAPLASEPARPQVQEPAQQPSAPQAVTPAQPPAPAQRDDNVPAAGKPRAPDAAAVPVALVTAQLCRTLSTSGSWQCEAAGDSVAPGRLFLYTRVKSPRNTVVVHRWYRGTALRQSVELEIRANANEGYRTFSRQTVDAGEEWRLEVRSASGDLLHEQRVSVR